MDKSGFATIKIDKISIYIVKLSLAYIGNISRLMNLAGIAHTSQLFRSLRLILSFINHNL